MIMISKIDPLPIIIIPLCILGLIFTCQPQEGEEHKYEYGDTGAISNENICISTSRQLPNWFIKVLVVDEIEDNAVGQWSPSEMTIRLKKKGGTDVNTIAHEVYHMVEDIMEQFDITDPHVGAYLQGNWTECVLDVIQHQGQFKFSN